jgi:hypothetical protein
VEDVVAQRHAAMLYGQAGVSPVERATLIKDAVGGKLLLGDQALHPAAGHHRRAVIANALVRDRHPQHLDCAVGRGGRRKMQQGLPLPLEEALPLHQVLRRVAAHQLLRVGRYCDAVLRHGGGLAKRALDVGVDGAHRRVDGSKANADQSHEAFTITLS